MFKKTAEEQILRGADKLISMKEDVDSLSWLRVSEIAKFLQLEHTEEQRFEWARELIAISHANTSILDKFGVPLEGMTGKMIASGMELVEGDRYLIKNDSEQPSNETLLDKVAPPVPPAKETHQTDHADEQSSVPVSSDQVLVSCKDSPPYQADDLADKQPTEVENAVPEKPALKNSRPSEPLSAQFVVEKPAQPEPFLSPSAMQAELNKLEAVLKALETRENLSTGAACQEDEVLKAAGEACQTTESSASHDVSRFKQLYSNKTGSLCLYEDANGHLVAVDPTRFA